MESMIEDTVNYQVIRSCKTSKTSREDLYGQIKSSDDSIGSSLKKLTQRGIIDNVQVGQEDLFLLRNNIELQIFYDTWSTKNIQRNPLYKSISNDYGFPLQDINSKLDHLIEVYVQNYLENYRRATLRRMCIEDFVRALNIKNNFENTTNLEKALFNELSKYEKPKRPYELI